ncbi:ComEA family DNA-binding protein [Cellulomonas soli]|uniref:ComEA family DNA-binding protein n=1 Tax=Cellulomonas soli TaxID=931535 RepID=UPI003F87F363
MPPDEHPADGTHARLHGLLQPTRVTRVPEPDGQPPGSPGVQAGAGSDASLSAEALARAAVEYRARYGDPVTRASAVPRRRVRWAVPWRLAGAAGVLVLLLAGTFALRSLAVHPGDPVTLPVPVPDATLAGNTAGADPAAAADPAADSAAGGEAAGAETDLVVHVVGHVTAPGVVHLPSGARVADAVAAAGGALAEADLAALNLAREVTDGEQIVVPAPGEVVAGTSTSSAPGDDRVDLNTADLAALDALPGIGPVLAQRIVDHRSADPFTSVDQLDDVSGVGPALLADLRELVRV